jgi:DNA topoisomerase-1
VRDYVQKTDGRLYPQEIGKIVNDLLSDNFPDIINVGFTAQMEEKLDQIAKGEREWISLLREFYPPFEKTLERAKSHIDRIKLPVQVTDEVCPECGKPMVIKTGRYGKFLACSGYPQCKTTKPLSAKTGVACPQCGGDLIERRTKKGRKFYGCSNFPNCQFATNRRPIPHPCPQCNSLLLVQGEKIAKCVKCGSQISLREIEKGLVNIENAR